MVARACTYAYNATLYHKRCFALRLSKRFLIFDGFSPHPPHVISALRALNVRADMKKGPRLGAFPSQEVRLLAQSQVMSAHFIATLQSLQKTLCPETVQSASQNGAFRASMTAEPSPGLPALTLALKQIGTHD